MEQLPNGPVLNKKLHIHEELHYYTLTSIIYEVNKSDAAKKLKFICHGFDGVFTDELNSMFVVVGVLM